MLNTQLKYSSETFFEHGQVRRADPLLRLNLGESVVQGSASSNLLLGNEDALGNSLLWKIYSESVNTKFRYIFNMNYARWKTGRQTFYTKIRTRYLGKLRPSFNLTENNE